MARTGEASIRIRNNGTPLGVLGFTTIDLTGSLTGVDEGNGVVGINGSGGSAGSNVDTRVLTATQSGSNITLDLSTLPHSFVAVEVVFRNGQAITPVASWSLAGSIVTVFNADASEQFMVQYTW